jgi:sialate O-acetylesterase
MADVPRAPKEFHQETSMRVRVALLTAVALLVPALAWAEVKPNALCSEGMVLQQKAKVKIWGSADKGEKVTVSFRGKEGSATADDHGKWVVTLDSGEAGGPFPLSIAGSNKIDYKNVLVGEVWVASGQSNMEWSVAASNQGDKDSATKAPANPMLRMFTVQKNPQAAPVDDVKGTWVEAAPNTVLGFSAVGYFFGRDLQKDLKVPVGIIHTSWGGTRSQAWTSKAALDSNEVSKHEHESFGKALEAHKKDPDKVKSPVHSNAPSVLYNGMIHPILNYAIKGAIWYQGESNAGEAYKYRTLFPMMIKNWREDFKQGDFAFFWVQLAPFTGVTKEPVESDWAELREAQSMTLKLPHSGQAVITDLGNEYDIHPTPKLSVGERLSLIARATIYGEKIEYSGPVFKEMKIEGNKAVLSFDHLGGALVSKELEPTLERKDKSDNVRAAWRVKPGTDGAPLTGFTICGEDHKFHNAKAEILGDKVVVSCDAVTKPVAVRFGWSNHPLCNLYNKAGLPASPFRTDDFLGKTQPKK